MIVLDTWALIAHLRDEPSAAAIRDEWLDSGAAMCSVNLGEALYMEIRVCGPAQAGQTVENARRELTVLDPDWDLVVMAAKVKASGGLSYADAFCVATAERLGAVLWTGDPEIIGLAEKLPCEVRDLRPTRG
ncbi:MAG TPA: type II toxin-antitoxin system VapC family toxin [Solirubrobacterales bacterium]|nr:type II toxin-antitoxin system VapC family toxin [Solirubrobacterales bacterium]